MAGLRPAVAASQPFAAGRTIKRHRTPIRQASENFRASEKSLRAQPIGISAAPKTTGQARGEGERMTGPGENDRQPVLFLGRDASVFNVAPAGHGGLQECRTSSQPRAGRIHHE
jgi:hypothetical protein